MIGTLTRIRFAEVVAWRTEFLLWLMTLTMPLIMLVFWRAVTRDGAFAGYATADVTAYFMAVLVVALVTECNMVWNLNEDIRTGGLSYWLIRPVHPLVNNVSITLAELPARLVIALPLVAIAMSFESQQPVMQRLATGFIAMALALAINQAVQILIGSLGFWMNRSIMVHRLYEAVSSVLSGYLFPLAFLPDAVREFALWLPFRFMVSVPVEMLTGRHDAMASLWLLTQQFGVALLLNAVALFVWSRGVRRYAAYGG
jgi:ABC-2 type transport system permease protein